MAKAHLDATLPGQAGPQIDAMVAGFANVPADNYAPANLGQLKAVAKPFYDRLIAAGYDTRANLVAHGFTGAGVYPWNPATPAVDNYVPANLGQLKMAFSFSVSGDPFNGGPPPPVKPSPGGDGTNIILTWSSGLGISSYTVERWQNGAWVTVSTTPGSGPGSSANPNVTDQSTAGGGSSNLAPGVIYLYRVTTNGTNGHSSETVLGAMINPDENDDTDTLTNGQEVDAGYYCKELGEGEIDEGTLEMGGNPAGWVGPDPKLDDTDTDGVKDDTDGWANNPDISTAPRLPAVRYAAVAIDEMGFPSDYIPIAVNDKCQVVGYKEDPEDPYAEFDYVFWDIKTGQATAIDLDGVPQKGGLNNSGVVCGVVNTNGDQVAAKWTKDGGQELLDPVVPAVLSGYEEKTFTPYVLGINDDGEVVGSEYYSGWNSEEEELVGSREGASAVICGQSLFGPTQYVTSEYNPTSYSIDGEKHFVPKMIKNGLTIGTVASYYPEEDNPLEDEGFSAIYDSELKVLDEFDVATAVNDAGYVVGQHQESGSPDNGKFYLWTKKNGAWKKGDLIPGLNYDQPAYVNNRLEVTDYQNLTIIRNGVPLDIPDLLGSPWLGYGLINGFNNLGVIVTEGTPVAGQSHKHLLVPTEIAPDVLRVNSNFDEKKIDTATTFAKADNDDDDLKAERGDKAEKIIVDDLYKGFWGVNPSTLPPEFYTGATVTIKKKPETNDETGQPEEGTIRLYTVKNLGQTGEQAYAIPISNGAKPTISSDAPANLATTLYSASSTIPKGDGVTYYIEGVHPGPITLEFKYVKGSLTFTYEQKFEVYTKQSKEKWQEEIRQQVLLETSNSVDLANYNIYDSFMTNSPYLQKVYAYYEELFRQKANIFYWAGLAKLAGGPVYAGLNDAEYGRTSAPWWIANGSTLANSVADFFQLGLMSGNRDIYDDLGWQFRAYHASGIWALRYVADKKLDQPSIVKFNIEPWNQIYMGDSTSNATLVKSGNLELTRREQRDIVQPDWSMLGSINVNWLLSILAKNPLSGEPDFTTVVPGGDITVFSSRWAWIEGGANTIWTGWTGYSDSNRMARVLTNLKFRAQEYSWFYWYDASSYPIKW